MLFLSQTDQIWSVCDKISLSHRHKPTKYDIIVSVKVYEKVYDEAIGNYGLFRTTQAEKLGISKVALLRLAARGKLERLAYGLYRIDKYVPSKDGLDAYACAVAKCGENAYLWGPSVLALRDLCPTDPAIIYVATPDRFRSKQTHGIVVKDRQALTVCDNIEGISTQNLPSAILASQNLIMLPRLLGAVETAKERGLIDNVQAQTLIRELYRNDHTT